LDQEYAESYPEVLPGDYVLLAITDTGCGMSEETKSHMFEPFFTTKPLGKGTGLGLATVFGIVKQCGGHLSVYSEVNKGTTIKIYLPPLKKETEKPAAKKSQFKIPRGTETVLLAEDEEGLRIVSRVVLQTNGYLVLEAANGEEALALAKGHSQPIHLLLADLVMPRKGGRELADEIGAIHPETKVLYMSGYTDDAVVRLGVLEADMPFLQKPFTPAALARKVREVLDMKT
jgi:two-component system cell cycle sensor histidine kinase/response regulator CckA